MDSDKSSNTSGHLAPGKEVSPHLGLLPSYWGDAAAGGWDSQMNPAFPHPSLWCGMESSIRHRSGQAVTEGFVDVIKVHESVHS